MKNASLSEQYFVKIVCVSIHNSATVHAIRASFVPKPFSHLTLMKIMKETDGQMNTREKIGLVFIAG